MRKKIPVSLWLLLSGLAVPGMTQENVPLDEEFLVFLASGMEIDGEWRDPMSLLEMVELSEVPEDRLAEVNTAQDLEEAEANEEAE